ncbi:unnamed protein product [Sphagnum balticum]
MVLFRTGFASHDSDFTLFVGEGDCGDEVGAKIDAEYEYCGDRRRDLQNEQHQKRKDLCGLTTGDSFVLKGHSSNLISVNYYGIGSIIGLVEGDVLSDHDLVDGFGLADDVALSGDGGCGDWLIASDHDDLYSCSVALGDGKGDCIAGRVVEGDDSHEALSVEREVGVDHVINGELKIFSETGSREVKSGKP